MIPCAIAAPTVSIATSTGEGVRDGTKLWWNSSLAAIRNAITIAIVAHRADHPRSSARTARNASAPRMAYSVRWASFRITKCSGSNFSGGSGWPMSAAMIVWITDPVCCAEKASVDAEKPSVARDLAAVLGATRKGAGCLVGDGHVVTWAIGHLVALPQPHEIRPEWKSWRREQLPMLPSAWPLVVTERVKEQFEAVRTVITDPRVTEIVCATDAGREGELIFRQLYEAAGCTKPVKRLWISSLTPDAIRDGLARLRPAREYDRLADAARGRSRADWLVGMNFSRAFTLVSDEMVTVGRVQTPTLAMVVERELLIRAFVSEEDFEVVATFEGETGRYRGTFFDPAAKETRDDGGKRLPKDGDEARRVVARAQAGTAAIESATSQSRRIPPPLLFDLTELQRQANRLFSFSAKKTLDVAQRLYEAKKAITYPRTDSRHLSRDVAQTLPRLLRALAPAYGSHFAQDALERPLGSRFVDDAKVSDHHAIIPTPTSPKDLDRDEQALYDLIVRRQIAAWHPEHVAATTTVITSITSSA